MIRALVLLAALSASLSRAAVPAPQAWRDAGFSDVTVTRLSTERLYAALPAFDAAGTIEPAFLLLRGSGWTEAHVDEILSQLARVYSQCGLRLAGATLVEATAPSARTRFYKYRFEGPGALNELARPSPLRDRPVYYLFAGFLDANDDAAFSRADFGMLAPSDGPRDPAMFDSVFLPSGVSLHGPYSVAAHELWHVLTREGQHYDETPRHLGNIWRDRADLITERDCRLIMANPLVSRP